MFFLLDSLVSSPIRDVESSNDKVYRLPSQEFVGFWALVEKTGKYFKEFGAVVELPVE
jgi:hypothetical protein